MSLAKLNQRLEALRDEPIPLAGQGATPQRLARMFEAGREDLTLAKLIEAHWDAVSILIEAGRTPSPGVLYAVWAAEVPGNSLELSRTSGHVFLHGSKAFCTGSHLADRALVTVTHPTHQLVDVDLRTHEAHVRFDASSWHTPAFAATRTAIATVSGIPLEETNLIGAEHWYLDRPGFWHGALGPAACWAGGAAGLVDYAQTQRQTQRKSDPHTLAHLGAMQAAVWGMQACLRTAGSEIDADPLNKVAAQRRALTVRHLVEQSCTDILRRFSRAFGPHPLVSNESIGRRYAELDLYLRQSHAERDLAPLGDLPSSPVRS
jgi:alkylation response protein AidB-like acyl-CoA dehydrogenase